MICVFASEVAGLAGYNCFTPVEDAIEAVVARLNPSRQSSSYARKRNLATAAQAIPVESLKTFKTNSIQEAHERKAFICEVIRSKALTRQEVRAKVEATCSAETLAIVTEATKCLVQASRNLSPAQIEQKTVQVIKEASKKIAEPLNVADVQVVVQEVVKIDNCQTGIETEEKMLPVLHNTQKAYWTTMVFEDQTKVKIYGKLDGVFIDAEGVVQYIQELKTRKNKPFLCFFPNEEIQMHVYMYLAGCETAEFMEVYREKPSYREILEFDHELWKECTAKLCLSVATIVARITSGVTGEAG
jgi:hypothetical protein